MSINITDHVDINTFSETTQASGHGAGKSPKPSFFGVLRNHLSSSKTALADQARARSEERKIILNQMLERLRAESEAKRQDLLTELMRSDEDEKPYDVFGKCLNIARKIMRGERVSAEEMQFLARYFPELLFQALLLRDDKPDRDKVVPCPKEGIDGAYLNQRHQTMVIYCNPFGPPGSIAEHKQLIPQQL